MPVLLKHRFGISVSMDGLDTRHDRIRYYRESRLRRGTWAIIDGNVRKLTQSFARAVALFANSKRSV